MIPKIIHYCWFGPKAYSRTVCRCMATWRKHLSGYEFMLWNEQTCAMYAMEHGLPNPMQHPFVVSAYQAKKYAFVADYVRFWALYYVGGIYLDTDMYVVRGFDDLLEAEFFCGWETAERDAGHGTDSVVSCGALGACARDILAKYDTLRFDETHLADYIVPRIITPIILQHKEATIYPYDYFYPYPFVERMKHDFLSSTTNNTFAIHLWDISWYPWYKKILRQVVIEFKKIKYFRMHKILLYILNSSWLWCSYLLVRHNPRFVEDLKRWAEWKSCPYKGKYMQFVCLMSEYKEFRNICYYRMGKWQYLVRWMCPPLDSLYIHCKDIGGGLLIQHGFSTIIQAERIGKNAKIFQQVTIGYNGDKCPVLGDNVEVCCGAKVIGGVHIGDNVTIGAQALVVKDVENNVAVGGVPARVIKRK